MTIRPRRASLLLLGMLLVASRGRAQDHASHAAAAPPRAVGGSFVLRTLDGAGLPVEFPSGSGARLVGGTLELRLAGPDSGRFALRFAATLPGSDSARSSGPDGAVRVTADSLLFWPDGLERRPPVRFGYAWTASRALELTDTQGHVWGYARATTDSGFAGVQSRGREVMGVDQYTSTHVFETLADGGRIVLQRDSADADGEATIRGHLQDIQRRFARGDFTLPGQVHGMEVPGTREMARRGALIRYVMEPLPRGGQVRIITRDAAALRAVHEFLAFQRMDHRAAGHDH